MSWLEALILGLVQGLTEYLPVSSSGHLTIGNYLFGIDGEANLAFNVLVHVATVCATLVILWKEIVWIFKDLFKFQWNEGTKYAFNIIVSMIPILIVGFCFKDKVEALFNTDTSLKYFGNSLFLVGCCLLLTSLLLTFSFFAKPRPKEKITPWNAFIIGIAQACAVLPGLSRSGSTIATGLLLGNKKETLAQFSFLMVIVPILGEALLDVKDIIFPDAEVVAAASSLPIGAAIVGFIAAFVSGCLACKWMINIVKKGKLIWFAIYCAIIALVAIIVPYLV